MKHERNRRSEQLVFGEIQTANNCLKH